MEISTQHHKNSWYPAAHARMNLHPQRLLSSWTPGPFTPSCLRLYVLSERSYILKTISTSVVHFILFNMMLLLFSLLNLHISIIILTTKASIYSICTRKFQCSLYVKYNNIKVWFWHFEWVKLLIDHQPSFKWTTFSAWSCFNQCPFFFLVSCI